MPRNRGVSCGSVETQGRQGEIGNWAFGNVPETNVGNMGWREGKPLSRTGDGQIEVLGVSR